MFESPVLLVVAVPNESERVVASIPDIVVEPPVEPPLLLLSFVGFSVVVTGLPFASVTGIVVSVKLGVVEPDKLVVSVFVVEICELPCVVERLLGS